MRSPRPHLSLRALLPQVLTPRARTWNLVDVRSPDEFTGKVIAPPGMTETAQRGGHIPGAKSIPWSMAVNPDGTFKSADELRTDLLWSRRASIRRSDDRLLPHRRALQPYLVRAEIPARPQQRAELRRQLDRIRQHGRRRQLKKRVSELNGYAA